MIPVAPQKLINATLDCLTDQDHLRRALVHQFWVSPAQSHIFHTISLGVSVQNGVNTRITDVRLLIVRCKPRKMRFRGISTHCCHIEFMGICVQWAWLTHISEAMVVTLFSRRVRFSGASKYMLQTVRRTMLACPFPRYTIPTCRRSHSFCHVIG